MERAGLAAADEILRLGGSGSAAVVCGAGNNGGDGFVVARHLHAAGWDVECLLAGDVRKLPPDARLNHDIAKRLGIAVVDGVRRARLKRADVVVDALLGTGFRGAPRGAVAQAIEAMRPPIGTIVALDVPSGVDGSTGAVVGAAVRADVTVCFHGRKLGTAVEPGRSAACRVVVADIGIPREADRATAATLLTGAETLAAAWPKAVGGSKYTAGAVLVIGGAPGYVGAPLMTALAALRASAGVAWIAAPSDVVAVLEGRVPEIMVRALPDALELLDKADAVALGPGLGRSDDAVALARRVAAEHAGPVVIDADGLFAFNGKLGRLRKRPGPTVLTPHEGEMARLLGVESDWVTGQPAGGGAEGRERERLRRPPQGLRHADRRPGRPRGRLACRPPGSRDGRLGRRPHRHGRRDACEGRRRPHRDVRRGRGARTGGPPRGRAPRPVGHHRDRCDRRPAGGDPVIGTARARATVSVDLAAVAANVARLVDAAAPAEVWAVVKADGYGHGAADGRPGRARGGRAAAVRGDVGRGPRRCATSSATPGARDGAARPGPGERGGGRRRDGHVGRGVRAPSGRGPLAARRPREGRHRHGALGHGRRTTRFAVGEQLAEGDVLALAGLMSHLAVADADDAFAREQVERFAALADRFPACPRHIANSAAVLRHPEAGFDTVRCGIAVYGLSPFAGDPAADGLQPALRLESFVRRREAACGRRERRVRRRFVAPEPTWIGLVPAGYADGVPRVLSGQADVLVRGRRRRIAATVSMDQLTFVIGPDCDVERGRHVTLIGEDSGERILVEEWAGIAGTINYEIVTSLGPRPRRVEHVLRGA